MLNPTARLRLAIAANPAGYSLGTYEYIISDGDGGLWFDGGYPSRAMALREGRAMLAAIERRLV